jgi:predicted GNAT family acetyltransferase
VLGARHDSLSFARAWQERTGQPIYLGMAERIYKLDRVVQPQPVPGHMREITTADRDILIDWFQAFSREALHKDDREGSERSVDLRLRSAISSDFFWEDGEPVSLTGVFRSTPNGARIGPVYTPPEHRGRGYASACVAAASQRMLDEGRQFCFLFTDLSNPTSNHIYQQIGYQPVVDMDEYRFG